MPQDIEYQIPFPPRISADVDNAAGRSLRWARRYQLITNSVDDRRIRSWDIADLMGRWAPLATGPALDLLVDAVNFATILDDQFDNRLADRPAEVKQACANFHDVIHATTPGTAPVGAGPLVRAAADVWSRLCAGRSPYFRARAAMHWGWYLDGFVDESRNRADRRVPNREEYFGLRRKTGFVYGMVDLTEAAYGFETARTAYELPVIGRLHEILADVDDSANDVQSFEKEKSRGDVNNLVIVLQHEHGGTRDECVAEIVTMVNSWVREFVQLERRLGDACATGGLTDAETTTAHRLVDILRSAMRGYVDWGNRTERYSCVIPPDEPTYATLV